MVKPTTLEEHRRVSAIRLSAATQKRLEWFSIVNKVRNALQIVSESESELSELDASKDHSRLKEMHDSPTSKNKHSNRPKK